MLQNKRYVIWDWNGTLLSDKTAGGKIAQGQTWFKQSGLAQEHVVLIGDTDHDFEVAQALGVDCIPSLIHF